MIFVFGSNEAGRHGLGAAKTAVEKYGAIHGQGVGLQGDSYAIPTKDRNIKTLPLDKIHRYVEDFKIFAQKFPQLTFYVTRIGCGLANYDNKDIAPLFKGSPANCVFDVEWRKYLGEDYNYFSKTL